MYIVVQFYCDAKPTICILRKQYQKHTKAMARPQAAPPLGHGTIDAGHILCLVVHRLCLMVRRSCSLRGSCSMLCGLQELIHRSKKMSYNA